MNKEAQSEKRGWFPKEPINQRPIRRYYSLNKRVKTGILIGGSILLIVCGFFFFVFIGFLLNPIIPTDVRIHRTIDQNKDSLENTEGVLAAGIRGNETSQTHAINIYIDKDSANFEAVPKQLGDYPVVLVEIDNSHPWDRGTFYWFSAELNLWPLENSEAT